MISSLSIITVWVLDQDEARDFYTEKLGFVLHTDATTEDFRWLTVCPPEQPDLELTLCVPAPPMVDADTAAQIKALIAKGAISGGVMRTKDCRRSYAELTARGVEFVQEPQEVFYGVDAAFRDNSGNLWRLVQPADDPSRELPPGPS
jgi:catechol 2,3-dioxygenase-like lactoylglutathione lyase family enzyme